MPQQENQNTRGLHLHSEEKGNHSLCRSWFFGIGINHYQHFSDLNNAVKDVQNVLTLLTERYEVHEKILLFDEKATRDNIIAQFDRFAEVVNSNDKLLIYYSGHGTLNKRGKGFWIPYDATKGSTARYLSNANLRDKIEDIHSRHTLLISDSCFSGALFIKGKFRLADTTANQLEARPSRWAICSGRQDQEVYDGEPGTNSPFASNILKVLKENSAANLHVNRFADRVMELTTSKERQLPLAGRLFDVGDEGGQYVFRMQSKVPTRQLTWQEVLNLPEDDVKGVNKKIIEIDNYIQLFPQTEILEQALELGEYLEHKRDFLLAKESLFRLRKFVAVATPFQEEAQRLIEDKRRKYAVPEAPSVKLEALTSDEEKVTHRIQAAIHQSLNLPSDSEQTPSKDDALPSVKLGRSIGLKPVKEWVIELMDFQSESIRRQQAGLSSGSLHSRHLVFTGNPGTGKTMVAEILGEMYREIGLLQRGHLVSVSRANLVGQYMGQTARVTREVIRKALDGVLFIDETYSLVSQDSIPGFGSEAVAELIQAMEQYRDRLVVIFAGYPEPMEAFLHSNPGLKGRFPKSNYIHFPDYSSEELFQILEQILRAEALSLSGAAQVAVKEVIEGICLDVDKNETFSNAHEMRNLAESLVANRAQRVFYLKLAVTEPIQSDDIDARYTQYRRANPD